MSAWIRGSQLMALVKITDSDLAQNCISHNLTPFNDQGQPIRPAAVVIQHIRALEEDLTQLDKIAWDRTGLEREKIIENQMQPLEERLRSCRRYLHSIENLGWDEFKLPQEHDLAACFVTGWVNSYYRKDEVDRILKENTKPPEEGEPLPVKSKPSRSVNGQERIKNCRETAKQIWNQQPDLTITEMINRHEIILHAKRSDGSTYSEMTVRSWIRDLCPNRRPGRRPGKRLLLQAC